MTDERPASMATADVVEWRFEAADIDATEQWLWANGAFAGDDVLHDVVLDTVDARLRGNEYSLRIRLLGDAAEALLEPVAGSKDARVVPLAERLRDTAFAAPLAAPGPVGARLRSLCGRQPLVVVRETQTQRHRYWLELGGEQVAEALLDRVDVTRGDAERVARRCMLTVATTPENVSHVSHLVGQLRRTASLSLAGPGFDMERLGTHGDGERAASNPKPHDAATVGEFVASLLRSLRLELVAWEPGARLGDDPEALHQMRVTVRRFRTALELFAPHLPSRAAPLREELRWLGGALGEVRDLDVQIERLATWPRVASEGASERASLPDLDRTDLDPLIALMEARRTAARSKMIEVLDSPRYPAFIRSLAEFADECERAGPARVHHVAPGLLERRYRQVQRLTARLRGNTDAAGHHALRIRVKRLRYTLELFEGAYGRPARRLARDARALQEALGRRQDAHVAATNLLTIGRDPLAGLPAPTIFSMGVLAEWHRTSEARQRGRRVEVRGLSRKRWSALSRSMRRKRRATPLEMPVVIEAHGLDEGVPPPEASPFDTTEAAAPHDGNSNDVHDASVGGPSAESLEALADAVAQHVVATPPAGSAPAARRLLSGMLGFF